MSYLVDVVLTRDLWMHRIDLARASLTADHDRRIVADIVAEWAHRHGEPYSATCLTPSTGRTLRRLGDLAPTTLALMHGPSYAGDGAEQLRGLADAYDERLAAAGPVLHAPVQRPEAARIN